MTNMSNLRLAGLVAGTCAFSAVHATPVRAESTELSGAAYAALCQSRGVPLPPPWRDPAWVSNGMLPGEDAVPKSPLVSSTFRTFIVTVKNAYVWFVSTPQGVCMALPRYNEGATQVDGAAFGVICQATNGKTCFWDNARPVNLGDTTVITSTDPNQIPNPPVWIGGKALETHGGGTCSDCHAGRNPFITVPGYPTDLRPLGINVDSSPWYDPIVTSAWPQNPGPGTFLDNVAVPPGPFPPAQGSCALCHGPTTFGNLPAASTNLSGWCGSVARRARERERMPVAAGPKTVGTVCASDNECMSNNCYPQLCPWCSQRTCAPVEEAPQWEALFKACSQPPPGPPLPLTFVPTPRLAVPPKYSVPINAHLL